MSNQSNQNKVRNSILNSHFSNFYIPNFASIGRFDLVFSLCTAAIPDIEGEPALCR